VRPFDRRWLSEVCAVEPPTAPSRTGVICKRAEVRREYDESAVREKNIAQKVKRQVCNRGGSEQFDDGQTATKYETELQLFPKKCEVKPQNHSNHVAGREGTPKNGQDLRSRIRREKSFVVHHSLQSNRTCVIVHVKRKHEIHILALVGKEKCITRKVFEKRGDRIREFGKGCQQITGGLAQLGGKVFVRISVRPLTRRCQSEVCAS
jgi:hypothetical protein